MKNSTRNLPVCSSVAHSVGRSCPARSGFVPNGEGLIDAGAAPRLTASARVPPIAAGQPYSWWAQSYNQGLPAVGGRYMFLRGAWLPGSPCAGWNASASWGACAPSTGEAC
jgi:hypothetical protein